jgi:hypothetical protein
MQPKKGVMRREPPSRARMQASSPLRSQVVREPTKQIPAGAKGAVHTLFGQEVGDEMALRAGRGKEYDYRSVLEPTPPVTQCERAGLVLEPNVTPCYLCGQPIPDPSTLKGGPSHELYMECEHILPVTQARWFLDLYMTTRRPSDEWHQTAVRLEYAYAHRVCNQAKSNNSFVIENDEGNPIVDSSMSNQILKDIRKRASDDLKNPPPKGVVYSVAHKMILTKISTMVVKVRNEVILANQLNPIIEHVRRSPEERGMQTLARTATMVDPGAMSSGVAAVYQGSTAPTAQELKDASRSQIYQEYPQLESSMLRDVILRHIPAPPEGWTAIQGFDQTTIDEILDRYFEYGGQRKAAADAWRKPSTRVEREPSFDPYGIVLLTSVWYGVYLTLFNQLQPLPHTGPSAPYAPTFCDIYRKMSNAMLTSAGADLTAMFGSLPTLTDPEQRTCVDLGIPVTKRGEERAFKEAREERDAEEELLKDVETLLPPPDPNEDANYYFSGFSEELQRTFGLSAEEANAIEAGARDTFLTSYTTPQSALNAAAESVSAALTLTGRIDATAVETVTTMIRTLGDEQFATPAEVERMQAPPGTAGAGSGAPPISGGKRKPRRPLYG